MFRFPRSAFKLSNCCVKSSTFPQSSALIVPQRCPTLRCQTPRNSAAMSPSPSNSSQVRPSTQPPYIPVITLNHNVAGMQALLHSYLTIASYRGPSVALPHELTASQLWLAVSDVNEHRIRCTLPQSESVSVVLSLDFLAITNPLTNHAGQSTAGKTMSTTINASSPKERSSGLADKYECPTLQSFTLCCPSTDTCFRRSTVLSRLSLAMPQRLGPEMERSARSGQLPCRSRALSGPNQRG